VRKQDEQEEDSEELWDSKALGQYGSGTEKIGRTMRQWDREAGGQSSRHMWTEWRWRGKGSGTLSQLDSGQRRQRSNGMVARGVVNSGAGRQHSSETEGQWGSGLVGCGALGR
jgi:hypothetical protein